jgi:hypothetical protein
VETNNSNNNSDVKPLEEVLVEHLTDKRQHLELITSADEALAAAQRELEEGRRRLQNALDRYKERMSGTT